MGRPQGTKKLVSDKISQLEGNRTSTQSQSPDSLPTVDFASSQDCSIKVCVCVCVHACSCMGVRVCVCVGPTWTQKSLCTCVVFPRKPSGLRGPCVCVCVCVCLSVCLSLSKEDFWSPWTQRLLHACVSVCMCV